MYVHGSPVVPRVDVLVVLINVIVIIAFVVGLFRGSERRHDAVVQLRVIGPFSPIPVSFEITLHLRRAMISWRSLLRTKRNVLRAKIKI